MSDKVAKFDKLVKQFKSKRKQLSKIEDAYSAKIDRNHTKSSKSLLMLRQRLVNEGKQAPQSGKNKSNELAMFQNLRAYLVNKLVVSRVYTDISKAIPTFEYLKTELSNLLSQKKQLLNQ